MAWKVWDVAWRAQPPESPNPFVPARVGCVRDSPRIASAVAGTQTLNGTGGVLVFDFQVACRARGGRLSFGAASARCAVFQHCRCPSIAVAAAQILFAHPLTGIPPMFQAAFSTVLPVPRHLRLNANLCPARSGQVAFTPPAHHAIVTGHSVTPFVYALRPAPPVARTRHLDCLAQVAFGLRPDCSGLRRDPT